LVFESPQGIDNSVLTEKLLEAWVILYALWTLDKADCAVAQQAQSNISAAKWGAE
jgi:hypothetical protein